MAIFHGCWFQWLHSSALRKENRASSPLTIDDLAILKYSNPPLYLVKPWYTKTFAMVDGMLKANGKVSTVAKIYL